MPVDLARLLSPPPPPPAAIVVSNEMSVSNEDIMKAIQGVSSRLDGLEVTAKTQGAQLGSFAEAWATMQAGQASAAAWQAEMATRMEVTDKIIAQLQNNLRKESPRHKQALPAEQAHVGEHDAPMHDAATAPVSASPPGGSSSHAASSAQRSSSVPSRGSKGDTEFALLQFPEPVTRTRAQAWTRENITPIDGLPEPRRIRILDSHDFVTYEFHSVDKADDFAYALRIVDLNIALRAGGSQRAAVLHDTRPLDVRRRGAALHPVYEILSSKIPAGRVLGQQHRARGPRPYTSYHAVDEPSDSAIPLCTIRWRDAGTEVQLLELIPEPDFAREVAAEFMKHIRPYGPPPSPGGSVINLLQDPLPHLRLSSWNVASLFGADGLGPLSASRHRRKMCRVVSLVGGADVVCLQETRGRRADLVEFSHFLPTYSYAGSFDTNGASGGVACLISATFAEKCPDRQVVEVVCGRIAILRCRGNGVPPIDIANVHLVNIPRLAPAAQIARLAVHLQPLDNCATFLLGDFNFLSPGDGRLDVAAGVHTHDDSPVARSFHELLPAYAEIRAEGYSRRQFREGRLQLLRRLDKVYTNLPTQDILACRPACAYTMSLADPHLESHHSPLKLVWPRPRAKRPFRVPRWVPEHLAYRAFADEYLALLPQLSEDPFSELRQTTMALQHAAKRVMRLPASMHTATRPSWFHWLLQGRAAWHRRDCSLWKRWYVGFLTTETCLWTLEGCWQCSLRSALPS